MIERRWNDSIIVVRNQLCVGTFAGVAQQRYLAELTL